MRGLRLVGVALMVGLVALAGAAEAQTLVKNPTLLKTTSPDATLVDHHEIAIARVSDGTVIQTLLHQGLYTSTALAIDINVQPIAFGTYTAVIRACAGTNCSDWSEASDPWERAPGRPSKPVIQ